MTIQTKISEKSKRIIREIVHETGESQISVIEYAVLAYHRKWCMRQLNKSYTKLKKNKRAWKQELKDRSILEKTSEDGLIL
jgi:molybdopterin synthase catalytic subunit